MQKNVLVTVKGMQFVEGESDQTEVITAGNYYWKNGKHYILYEEILPDSELPVKTKLKIYNGIVEVIKQGDSSVRMVFETGVRNESYYVTPMGNLLIGIETGAVEIKEEEDLIRIFIEYALAINCESIADCTIHIVVQSKDEAVLNLD